MISVCIPTIGRPEILNSVLMGIFNNREVVDEVIILDQGDTPASEAYQVSLAIDLLSLNHIRVNYIRQRLSKGIAENRYFLVKEARNHLVMMVDDDVVLDVGCISRLCKALENYPKLNWAVPHSLMVRNTVPNYIDAREVNFKNTEIQNILKRRPWFITFFNYVEELELPIDFCEPQASLVRRGNFLDTCRDIIKLKKLPREDTFMVKSMGKGIFVSKARVFHFAHYQQQSRHWDGITNYALHWGIYKDPKKWLDFLKDVDLDNYRKGL